MYILYIYHQKICSELHYKFRLIFNLHNLLINWHIDLKLSGLKEVLCS